MADINCIDVSTFQTGVDYNKVKNDGISTVIIRAGYGRELYQKDDEFETHYRNAKAAGLKVGAYWYSYSKGVENSKVEAKTCLECIKGKTFDLPIFYDLEDNSQTGLGKSTLTKMAEAFCEEIKKAGYRVGVYANLNWFENYLDYNYLKEKYFIWLAQYNTTADLDCDIWQNSSSGRITGVNGNCDTNIIYNDKVYSDNKDSTKIPDIFYRVRCDGKWLPEVKNMDDYAGIRGKVITDVAIRVSEGNLWYQAHTKNSGWLSQITDYDINDYYKGYAGNGEEIDALRVYYITPKAILDKTGNYLKAKYHVSALNSDYFGYQYDNETNSGQDGYAGLFGRSIDRLQIKLEQSNVHCNLKQDKNVNR